MNYIMGLDIVMGYEIIKTAYEKKTEEQLWKQYALQYPGWDEKTFITFEDYKIKAFGTTAKVDKDQILKDADLIKKADMAERG
jgi:hypothetical protein